mmetsp:Transcript_4353/g.12493  ORF Transcript_4353/g.12493 Transcript_4353/m.12493 type:complete len:625 (-) Transcript_4353:136-2010(-)
MQLKFQPGFLAVLLSNAAIGALAKEEHQQQEQQRTKHFDLEHDGRNNESENESNKDKKQHQLQQPRHAIDEQDRRSKNQHAPLMVSTTTIGNLVVANSNSNTSGDSNMNDNMNGNTNGKTQGVIDAGLLAEDKHAAANDTDNTARTVAGQKKSTFRQSSPAARTTTISNKNINRPARVKPSPRHKARDAATHPRNVHDIQEIQSALKASVHGAHSGRALGKKKARGKKRSDCSDRRRNLRRGPGGKDKPDDGGCEGQGEEAAAAEDGSDGQTPAKKRGGGKRFKTNSDSVSGSDEEKQQQEEEAAAGEDAGADVDTDTGADAGADEAADDGSVGTDAGAGADPVDDVNADEAPSTEPGQAVGGVDDNKANVPDGAIEADPTTTTTSTTTTTTTSSTSTTSTPPPPAATGATTTTTTTTTTTKPAEPTPAPTKTPPTEAPTTPEPTSSPIRSTCQTGTSDYLISWCQDEAMNCCNLGQKSCAWEGAATVCEGSCNGQYACYDIKAGTLIEENSCTDYAACAAMGEGVSIGTDSCNGRFACMLSNGSIGDGSCNGRYPAGSNCYEVDMDVGDNACNYDGNPYNYPSGSYACAYADSPVADGECNVLFYYSTCVGTPRPKATDAGAV